MDALSFHVYEYYMNKHGQFLNTGWGSIWNTEGTSINPKAAYLRSVFANYGVTNKQLFITEVALLCNPNYYKPFDPNACLNTTFDETKGVYMARAAIDALKNDMKALVWYKVKTPMDGCTGASISTWCYTGLVRNDLSLRPGMSALKTSHDVFTRANLVSSGLYQPNIMQYRLERSDRTVWMVHNMITNTQTVNLSVMPTSIFTAMGVQVPITTSVTITSTPLYIEWKR